MSDQHEVLHVIASLRESDPTPQEVAERLVAPHPSLVNSLSRHLAAKLSGQPVDFDVIEQEVRIALVDSLTNTPQRIPAAARYPDHCLPGYALRVAYQRLLKIAETERQSGITGAVAMTRKRIALERHRDALCQVLLREPTDEEAIDAHNAAMMASRSDPGRQGVLLKPGDLPDTVSHMELQDFDAPSHDDGSDTALTAHTLRDLVSRCRKSGDPVVSGVLDLLLAPALADSPIVSRRQMAAHLGVTPSVVEATVAWIREVASECLDARLT